MPENVYIFGAGINRGVNDWHGLVPPLATDFFQQAFHGSITGLLMLLLAKNQCMIKKCWTFDLITYMVG